MPSPTLVFYRSDYCGRNCKNSNELTRNARPYYERLQNNNVGDGILDIPQIFSNGEVDVAVFGKSRVIVLQKNFALKVLFNYLSLFND